MSNSLWPSRHHLAAGHGHTLTTAIAAVHQKSPRSRSRNRRERAASGIPKFLQQSPSDLKRKWNELEQAQNDRMYEATMAEDGNSPWSIDESETARQRNRYANIAPWESNRVRLQVPEECSDYINASPIVLHSRKDNSAKRYIATQGPKRAHYNHIWRMIAAETGPVAVVVMLTKTFELGRDKCFQYFPEDDSSPWELVDNEEFGDDFAATLTLKESYRDSRSSCDVRRIELYLPAQRQTKTVWHLLFKGWPDYNVPEGSDKTALLELIHLANDKNSSPSNPLIVHCSAGVGRSGTFITLDHLLREIDLGVVGVDEKEDLVYDTVNRLREQRMYMVQSEVQYYFCYKVLRERFEGRGKSRSPPTSLGGSRVSLVEGKEEGVASPAG